MGRGDATPESEGAPVSNNVYNFRARETLYLFIFPNPRASCALGAPVARAPGTYTAGNL